MVKAKNMKQETLWQDSLEDALRSVVDALGGPKNVGIHLWPTKGPQEAARYLNHCLDPERQEKLSSAEIVWILQAGARASCHIGMHFLNDICSYERAKPINKEDRRTELQRQFTAAVDRLDDLRKEMERLK